LFLPFPTVKELFSPLLSRYPLFVLPSRPISCSVVLRRKPPRKSSLQRFIVLPLRSFPFTFSGSSSNTPDKSPFPPLHLLSSPHCFDFISIMPFSALIRPFSLTPLPSIHVVIRCCSRFCFVKHLRPYLSFRMMSAGFEEEIQAFPHFILDSRRSAVHAF